MFLNGMIAVYQLLFSLVLCVPSSLVSDPPVSIPDLPQNMWNGAKCLFGVSSITCSDDGDDCYEDDCNPQGPAFVFSYIFFNQLYNLLILLILKFGSANILWMVPMTTINYILYIIVLVLSNMILYLYVPLSLYYYCIIYCRL
jgi:hypothetical protein